MVLFHACAHNPTGVDLNMDQWAQVSRICKEKGHLVVVDMAYQGFATGDLDRDAAGLRLLVKDGHKVMLCQSFAKNMGLYGEQRCAQIFASVAYLSPSFSVHLPPSPFSLPPSSPLFLPSFLLSIPPSLLSSLFISISPSPSPFLPPPLPKVRGLVP